MPYYNPKELIYDRSGKGQKKRNTKIRTPDYKPLKRDMEYQTNFKSPQVLNLILIWTFKTDFRMKQNYLSGKDSSQINALLVATQLVGI